jgi:membrane fusion protein
MENSSQRVDELFRNEALEARKINWLGEVVLIRPLSSTILTILAAVIGVCVIAFLVLGTYTKRTTVTGQLIPSSGLMKLYPTQPGLILEKHVSEGQPVLRGQLLYTLSSERESSSLGETQSAISRHIKDRQESLSDEIRKTKEIQSDELNTLKNKVKNLNRQLDQIVELIAIQKSRVAISREGQTRYEGLVDEAYVSRERLEEKQADVLDQESKLKSLVRDKASVEQDLIAQKNELAALPSKHKNQIAQIFRSLSNSDQELSENEAKRELKISSPRSGIVTGVASEVGQYVDSTHPLVSIIPTNSSLVANLYAPSKSIGFIQPGNEVLLRYQAYPYQKFGQQHGTVVSVSKTGLPLNELNQVSGAVPGVDASKSPELYYVISVQLEAQSILAYGNEQRLQSGMVVEADVLQDKRRIFEWVFEPLYSLKGKW